MNFIRNILNSRSKRNGNFFIQIKNIVGYKPSNMGYKRDMYLIRICRFASQANIDVSGRANQVLSFAQSDFKVCLRANSFHEVGPTNDTCLESKANLLNLRRVGPDQGN